MLPSPRGLIAPTSRIVSALQRSLLASGVLAVTLFCLAAGNAHAVDRFVDESAIGTGDGLSWPNAETKLQDALAAASSGDTIHVATGTYYPDETGATDSGLRSSTFQLISGVEILGGYPGGGGSRDPAANETTLSGDLDQNDAPNFANNDNNAYHVITGSGTDATTVLDGFTITAGNANGLFPDERGGALYNSSSSTPALTNCSFRGNSAERGGALCNANSSSPILTNCDFQSNTASIQGGAIYNENNASPALTNCDFQGNSATSGSGGAIRNSSSSPVLTNCSFQGNSATSGGGGAISNSSSSPTLTNCSFQGNSATTDGGAISNAGSSPTLTNCSFQGNSALDGGALYNQSSSSPTLTNCDFLGNNASIQGGAIWNRNFSSTPSALTNCSFQGNSADQGGAIYNEVSSPALTNCILWNNEENGSTSVPGASVSNASSTPTYSHCLVANFSKATLDATGTSPDDNFEPNDPLFLLEVDPAFAPTTGGDLRLDAGSPALNVGLNSANLIPTDLAGKPRIFNTTIDLGAFEQQNVLHVDHTATAPNDGSSWNDAFLTLQDALAAASSGDLIFVATGTYFPDEGTGQVNDVRTSTFQLQSGVNIYGGFPAGGSSFALRDPIANETTLSGDLDQNDGLEFTNNDNNALHVLTGSGTDASALLDGFTISAGNADGSGGGLFNNGSGSPTLTNCSFRGNFASIGGAIYNQSSSPTLTNCSFQGNSASSGGAIYNQSSSSPTLTNCSFQSNSASSGGAISNGSSSPTLTNCSFQGNSASSGGAIYNQSSSSPALTNCSFQGNSASSGGAIFNNVSSTPALTNCSFLGNSASGSGGAIFNNVSSAPALTNCSFQGNSASFAGGAIFNNVSSTPALTNCILWNNAENGSTAAPGASVANDSSIPTYSHCLVANFSKATLDATGTSPDDNFEPNDPLFLLEVDPASAPTTGGDLRLDAGSPALNAGLNSANLIPTDLAGKPRIFNTTIDLGTLEQQNVLHVDHTATAPNDGSSWNDAFLTPQDALAAASSGDLIFVATGTYYPDEGTGQVNDLRFSTFQLQSGVNIYGGFPAGGSSFALRDPIANETTLSGDLDKNDGPNFANNDNNALHVLTGSGTDASALLDGFTISAGNAATLGGGLLNLDSGSPTLTHCSFQSNNAEQGGAIFNGNSSSPAITHCSFLGNNASRDGGAIFNQSSSPSLTHCSFQANSASGPFSSGGAIFNSNSSPAFTNCDFLDNSAERGGAIFNSSSSPTLTHCSFLTNSASGTSSSGGGGAIYNIDSSSPALTNCDFHANSASGTSSLNGGGAIYNIDSSSPALTDCDFQSNSAFRDGGAIYNNSSSSPALTHCSFQGNSAINGGAIYNFSSHTLTNCSFQDNSATGDGGAIWNRNLSSAPSALTNCSFQGNSASRNGGAIYNESSSPALTNFDFLGNSASSGGAIYNKNSPSPTLTNCSFHGNSATSGGGAIYNESSSPALTNCSFQGNSATSGGGAILNESSSPALSNCSFQGNSATFFAGAIFNQTSSSPTFNSCIIWNNALFLSTTATGASVANNLSTPTYSHCLVANYSKATLDATGNSPDTNFEPLDPRFLLEVDPASAPVIGGDLRLFLGSPALDVGLNSANTTSTDLAGNPRIQNTTIDLGAYEGAVTDPALLWPTDLDKDGNPYGTEHALGTDPDLPDRNNPANLTKPTFNSSGHAAFTFGRNPTADPDTIWRLTRSPDMTPDSFTEIFRFDGPTIMPTNGTNVTSTIDATRISVTDENPPPGNAYYRFEAVYVP